MCIIVLDTETTGLPITKSFNNYYDPISTKYYDSSRIIELGYIVYTQDQKELFKRSFLIKPDNFSVTNTHIHGITEKMVKKDGINMLDALEILECDLIDVTTIIAHNINFDYNVLLSECHRYNKLTLVDKIKKLKKECTMAIGQNFLNQKKFPGLQALYEHFNTTNTLKAHRALDDAIMCADCYFNMKNKVSNKK